MSYDRSRVEAFVEKVLDAHKRNPDYHVLLRFVTLIARDMGSMEAPLDQLITEYGALSNWERGNVLYALSPLAAREVTKQASYYWGVARMEEHLELLGEADG